MLHQLSSVLGAHARHGGIHNKDKQCAGNRPERGSLLPPVTIPAKYRRPRVVLRRENVHLVLPVNFQPESESTAPPLRAKPSRTHSICEVPDKLVAKEKEKKNGNKRGILQRLELTSKKYMDFQNEVCAARKSARHLMAQSSDSRGGGEIVAERIVVARRARNDSGTEENELTFGRPGDV